MKTVKKFLFSKLFSVIVLICLFFTSAQLQASHGLGCPASPEVFTVKQPDGRSLDMRIIGNRNFNYNTTEDGYVIVKNESGYYVYGEQNNDDEWVPSKVVARNAADRSKSDKNFLKNYQSSKKFDARYVKYLSKAQAADIAEAESDGEHIQKTMPTKGAFRALVILVNYKDLPMIVDNPQESFNTMLNEKGYGTYGSAHDYFTESSMGQFTPTFDVVGPFTLPQNMQYYGGKSGDIEDAHPEIMVKDACKLAYENGVNFANYDLDNDGIVDNVFVIYAGNSPAEGGSSDNIWPHNGEVGDYKSVYNGKTVFHYGCAPELRGSDHVKSNLTGIGTFCHEFSHALGIPDLYCTTQNKNLIPDYVGWHDIMSMGYFRKQGQCPPTFNAIHRYMVGWATPTTISKPGDSYTLRPLSTSNESFVFSNENVDLSKGMPTESFFYIMENRQNIGFDTSLPGHGLLLWRIYYKRMYWTNNQVNGYWQPLCAVMPADNTPSYLDAIEGWDSDYFPGTQNITSYTPTTYNDKSALTNINGGNNIHRPFSNVTENADKSISFSFMDGDGSYYLNLAPKNPVLENYTGATATVNVDCNSDWSAELVSDLDFSINPSFGNGNGTITITARNSTSDLFLADTLIVTSKDFTEKVAINQSPLLIQNRCEWTSNLFEDMDTLTHYAINWGELTGQSVGAVDEMAEYFDVDGERILDSFFIYPFKSVPGDSNTSKITFHVYEAGISGPGKIIASKDVLLKDIPVGSQPTPVYFTWDEEVTVNGPFFIGYKLYYPNTKMDSFACFYAQNRTKRQFQHGTAYLLNGTSWARFDELVGLTGIKNISLAIGTRMICTQNDNIPAVVETKAPSNRLATSVTLNANIVRGGSKPVTERGFEYSTAANFGSITTKTIESSIQSGEYSTNIEGLTNKSMLYYRAYVITDISTERSAIDSVLIDVPTNVLKLNPDTTHVNYFSGSAFVALTASEAWTLNNPASWLSVSQSSGTGSTNLRVTAENNYTSNSRSAVVTFTMGEKTIPLTVIQESQGTRFLTVTPSTITFSKQTDTVTYVQISADSAWTASNKSEWLILGKTSGLGSDNITVAVNSYLNPTFRRDTVTIKQGNLVKTIFVTQTAVTEVKPTETTAVAGINIYPNPVNTYFKVEMEGVKQVEVASVAGISIEAPYSIRGNEINVNVEHLPSGIYTVSLITNKGMVSAKFIKQ